MYIFLDDYREPEDVVWSHPLPSAVSDEWIIVRNYAEFTALLDSLDTAPTYIAFDHDLADAHYEGDFSNPDEKTGYDCAKYMCELAGTKWGVFPACIVHSLNPVGKANIELYIEGAKKHYDR